MPSFTYDKMPIADLLCEIQALELILNDIYVALHYDDNAMATYYSSLEIQLRRMTWAYADRLIKTLIH